MHSSTKIKTENRKTNCVKKIKSRPRDLVAQSQSGTGKTAAFTLAMLSRVDVNVKKAQVRTHVFFFFFLILMFLFFSAVLGYLPCPFS